MRSPRSTRSWGCGVFLLAPLALVIALTGRAAAGDFVSLGIAWSLPLSSALVAPPIADERAVYLPLRDGTIAAMWLADGRPRWEIRAPVAHALALGGELVFAATPQELIGIEAESGRIAWRVAAPGAAAAPAWRGGWLVAGLAGGDLLAIRAADGRVMWRRPLSAPLSRPVTIDGDRVYAPLRDGAIAALDISNGATLWRTQLPAAAGVITAAGDWLYAGCTDNFFYALDAADGNRRWRWRTGADVIGRAAVDADRVYFVSLDNVLRALDSESGVQRWKYPMDSRPLAGPALDGDVLVLSGIGTAVRVVRAADGTLVGTWTAPRELAQPPLIPPESHTHPVRAVIVTGSDVGEWRLYGLGPSFEPAPKPLMEIPGRPLSPGGPPPPLEPRPPAASPLP